AAKRQAPLSAQLFGGRALRELLSSSQIEGGQILGGQRNSDRARCRAWLRERINERPVWERFVQHLPGRSRPAGQALRARRRLRTRSDRILCASLPETWPPELAVDPTSRSRRRQPPRPVVVSFDDDDAVSSAGSELSINRPDFPAAAAVSASAAAARSQPLQQPQASSQQQQQAPAPPLPPASESGYNTSACSEAEASLASGSAPWFSVTELRQALLDVSRAREREAAERRRAEDQCRALESQIGQLRRENGLLCQEVGREERLARLAEMHADLSELSAQLQQSLAQAQRGARISARPQPALSAVPAVRVDCRRLQAGAGPTRHHVYQVR
uniref:DUF4485 domain-containing protein n=1 Tax=Macrostomum lignano TaxID=282301 RepID=A0A1I8FC84_9PLAT